MARVTEADRRRLLAEYLSGRSEGKALSLREGLHCNYVTQLAKRRGHQSPTKARIARGWDRARAMLRDA